MNKAVAKIDRIISGGQTGADRAGLDVAIELKLQHGGYCPARRRAEDGAIPSHYQLIELASREYAERTQRNVVESDATLILCRGELRGGTRLTRQFARRYAKPLLVVDLAEIDPEAVQRVHNWLAEAEITTLNVAGPRESQNPGIYDQSCLFLREVFTRCS
ncbi:MAG: putative molybdenum carrier protein [Pirellulales bacterium]